MAISRDFSSLRPARSLLGGHAVQLQLHASATHPFAVMIDEALGAVLAPARRRQIIFEALDAAGLDAVPEEPAPLRAFLEGALFSALARHLEVSDAIELVAQLRAILELALSAGDDPPRSEIRERVTPPAAFGSALVVTNASLVVFLLGDMLGDRPIEVVPTSRFGALREELRRRTGMPLLVVVDRKHPAVDVSVCTLLRDELDARSIVLWWGAPSAEQLMVSGLLAGGPRVITCEPTFGLPDLGELCRRLLDEAC